jgi:hypothetical protein
MSETKRPKPGTRAAIEHVLDFYGLQLDSYRPGNVRLYAVEVKGTNERLSDRMEFDQLKNWVRGFITGREGKKSMYI